MFCQVRDHMANLGGIQVGRIGKLSSDYLLTPKK